MDGVGRQGGDDEPDDVDQLVEDGLERFAHGDLAGAILAWERALALDPDEIRAAAYVESVRRHDHVLAGAPPTVGDDEAFGLFAVHGEVTLGGAGPAIRLGEPIDRAAVVIEDGWSLVPDLAPGAAASPVPDLDLDPGRPPRSPRPLPLPAAPRVAPLVDLDADDPAGDDEQTRDYLAAARWRNAPTRDLTPVPGLAQPGLGEDLDRDGRRTPARGGATVRAGADALDLGPRGPADDDRTVERPAVGGRGYAPPTLDRARGARVAHPPVVIVDEALDAGLAAGSDHPRAPSDEPTGPGRRPGSGIEAVAARIAADVETGGPGSEAAADRARGRVERLIDLAVAAAGAGDHAAAVIALDLALAEDPDSAAVQKVIHRRDDAIVDVYRRFLGDLERRPSLAIPMHELPGRTLEIRAAFLLSRIDGTMTFDEILDVSGMRRAEAFRHLSMLVLHGILAVR
jgi:hypothetical protein